MFDHERSEKNCVLKLKSGSNNSNGDAGHSAETETEEYSYGAEEVDVLPVAPTVFLYDELVQATSGFSEEFLVGEGAYGRVFTGNIEIPALKSTRKCAVKKLKPENFQSHKEFMVGLSWLFLKFGLLLFDHFCLCFHH